MRAADVGNQPDVRELGLSADENDVARFDVAMHEPMRVEMSKGAGEAEHELRGIRRRQAAILCEVGTESARGVISNQ
jgi:hypothetical protein